MAQRDPYDVVGVLAALGRRLTVALAPMAGDGWGCLRVLPRIDGTAAVVITGPGGEATYNWVAPPAPEDPTDGSGGPWHWGQLLPPADAAPAAHAADAAPPAHAAEPQVARQVTRLLSAALARALAQPGFEVLRWCNRHRTALRFDDTVVDVLLADRLAPGRSRWFDHVFQDAHQGHAEQFHLNFAGPEGALQLSVTAPGVTLSQGEPLLEHRLFHLWLTADPRPPGARDQVRWQVERFGGFLLSRGVHAGMSLQSTGTRVGPGAGDTGVAPTSAFHNAPVSTSRWGNPLQWHQFFSDFEVSRSELCNVRFNEPVAYVLHGEPECCRVEPRTRAGAHSYARMPFTPGPVRPDPTESQQKLYLSLITERETVLGGDSSLDEALRRAAADPDTRLLYINNTCLPKMVGDDLDSLVARLPARTDKIILNLNTDLSSPDDSYRHMLAQAEKHHQQQPDPEEIPPGAVSFLGYVDGPYRAELMNLLAALDVGVAAFLLPELDVRMARRYRQGAVQVVYPRQAWQTLHAELFGDLETPVLEAPAPYGLRSTRQWLEAITGALGQAATLEARWEELAGAEVARLNALRGQVGDLRVGAVVIPDSAPRLYRAELLHGVSLLPLLEELGLGLDVLLLCPPDKQQEVEAAEAGLRGCLDQPARLTVHRFSSPQTLAEALTAAPCALVYSELACDQRLSRAGKTGFGVDLLEMGLPGAVRSLERLLGLARWPFYRRHARYLPPRPELAPGDPHG